ncbi:MAG: DUF72 domain-containing protein [Dehalococcoidia bacterium]
MTQYYVGTSGWHYEHWKGRFYPGSLPKSRWLEFYSGKYITVELNNSFYRLPTVETFTKWKNTVPEGFKFAIKVSRFITHIKRLKEVEEPLSKFLSHADYLDDKLGPLLYQLPPNMKYDYHLLERFLSTLPQHYSHIFEFRHKSWMQDDIFKLLMKYHVGFCVFDMPDFTCPIVATGDTGYIRFHGNQGLYSSFYSDEDLDIWVRRIREMRGDLSEVYIYFNNDAEAYAVFNAATIRRMLAGIL